MLINRINSTATICTNDIISAPIKPTHNCKSPHKFSSKLKPANVTLIPFKKCFYFFNVILWLCSRIFSFHWFTFEKSFSNVLNIAHSPLSFTRSFSIIPSFVIISKLNKSYSARSVTIFAFCALFIKLHPFSTIRKISHFNYPLHSSGVVSQ